MISIIVPIYNIAEYLPQCIESLLHQSFSDLEIILVDDGSTDGSFAICEHYRSQDTRIVVLHKKNGGLVSARKAGIKAARGQYIAYVDGDDWIEPDMYEQMYQKLIQENVDVVMCGRYEDTGRTRKAVFHGIDEGRYEKKALQKVVYPKMIAGGAFFEWGIFPGLWDKLYRRECIECFQLAVDERITMGEDAACVYPCLLNVNSIYVMKQCLYHYRQSSMSMVKKVLTPEREQKQFHILYHFVNQHLEQYSNIFDLRQQWKDYILFLMVPRADTLLEDIQKLDYLFPFPQVKRGSNIILYGMGTYGQRLYRYIKKTGICNIIMAADQNSEELKRQGFLAESPEKIADYSFDAIVVASSFFKVRHAIYLELVKKYPREKVHLMDETLIKSKDTQKRFGLIDDTYG